MNKLYKKGLLLSAVAMAACAMPSMASAANFDGVGQHTLTSSNLGFTAPFLAGSGSSCTSSIFEVNVAAGGASASVTGATFSGCTGTVLAAGPADVVGTNFPWPITRLGPGTFAIDNIHIVATFTGPSPDLTATLEGSVHGTIDCTAGSKTVTFVNSPVTTTTALGNGTSTVNGDVRDDQNTLCVT